MDKLKQANKLEKEIKEVEHFLHTVTRFNDGFNGVPAVKLFVKRRVSYRFFGSRFFGFGTHESEIKVPNSIRNDLIDIAERKINDLKGEQQKLFSDITTTK